MPPCQEQRNLQCRSLLWSIGAVFAGLWTRRPNWKNVSTDLYALTPEEQSKENDEKQYWIQRWLEVCDDPESVPVPRVYTPQKMSERIRKLRLGKGSPDGCTAELFYGLPKAAVCSLAVFFTSVLLTLQIPHVWTQGKATLIPKVVATN